MNVCMLHSGTYCHNALVTLIKGSTTWHSTTTVLVKCTQMCILYCPRLMPTTNLTVLWFCKVLCVIAHHAKSFLGDRTAYCCWANIHSWTFKVQKFSGKPYKMCIQEQKQQHHKIESKFGSSNAPGVLHAHNIQQQRLTYTSPYILYLVCCILLISPQLTNAAYFSFAWLVHTMSIGIDKLRVTKSGCCTLENTVLHHSLVR